MCGNKKWKNILINLRTKMKMIPETYMTEMTNQMQTKTKNQNQRHPIPRYTKKKKENSGKIAWISTVLQQYCSYLWLQQQCNNMVPIRGTTNWVTIDRLRYSPSTHDLLTFCMQKCIDILRLTVSKSVSVLHNPIPYIRKSPERQISYILSHHDSQTLHPLPWYEI